MRARPVLLGALLILSFIAPLLAPADAAPPYGAASGHGMIYPEDEHADLGGYFTFRLRIASNNGPPKGSFEFYILDNDTIALELENVSLISMGIETQANDIVATIHGMADMINDTGSFPVSFTATAVDGLVDDFSIAITSNGVTNTYENIGYPGTIHFSIAVRLH